MSFDNNISDIFPSNFKEVVIISPHIDDAIYSLGGLLSLLKKNYKVKIITIFSISNYTINGILDSGEATKIRKGEDLEISKLLDVEFLYLDFLEALLRGYEIDGIYKSTFNKDLNENMISEISYKIIDYINFDSIILSPCGFGGHIDHYITRYASQQLEHIGYKVYYYEELPYAGINKYNEIAIDFLKGRKVYEIVVNRNLISEHINLISFYKSQLIETLLVGLRKYLEIKNYLIWK